jgi:hypothetical protein
MKNIPKKKKEWTLGDLISSAYQIWGAGRAEKMVRYLFTARMVVLQPQPIFTISAPKARSL